MPSVPTVPLRLPEDGWSKRRWGGHFQAPSSLFDTTYACAWQLNYFAGIYKGSCCYVWSFIIIFSCEERKSEETFFLLKCIAGVRQEAEGRKIIVDFLSYPCETNSLIFHTRKMILILCSWMKLCDSKRQLKMETKNNRLRVRN